MARVSTKPTKAYGYQTLLGNWERGALAHLQAKHAKPGFTVSKADAIRYALKQQLKRDERDDLEAKIFRVYADSRVRVRELNKGKGAKTNKGEAVETMKPLTFHATPADLEALDGIAAKHEIPWRAEAFRFIIRVQAYLEGYRGPGDGSV